MNQAGIDLKDRLRSGDYQWNRRWTERSGLDHFPLIPRLLSSMLCSREERADAAIFDNENSDPDVDVRQADRPGSSLALTTTSSNLRITELMARVKLCSGRPSLPAIKSMVRFTGDFRRRSQPGAEGVRRNTLLCIYQHP
jgi:hypothetical protein